MERKLQAGILKIWKTLDDSCIPSRSHPRHGKGMQVWPDGARYEGDWADDKDPIAIVSSVLLR